MCCVPELIHRSYLPQLIATLAQNLQIPRERCRIAADIHDAVRFHAKHRLQTLLIASLPGRIDNDHIRMKHVRIWLPALLFVELRKNLLRFSHEKGGVGNTV